MKPQLNEQGEKEKDTVTTSQALQIAGRAGRLEKSIDTIRVSQLYFISDLQVLFRMVK